MGVRMRTLVSPPRAVALILSCREPISAAGLRPPFFCKTCRVWSPPSIRDDRVIRDVKAMRMTSAEPTIDEMLVDPIVRLLMDHDGVKEEDVRQLIKSVGRRLTESTEPAPGRCS